MRAADLIGQLGDPHYLRKLNALFHEFEETGMNRQLGYASPADLVDRYPQFYWSSVAPHIQTAIRYLNVTSSGRQWIANLYSNVFRAECGQIPKQPNSALMFRQCAEVGQNDFGYVFLGADISVHRLPRTSFVRQTVKIRNPSFPATLVLRENRLPNPRKKLRSTLSILANAGEQANTPGQITH